MHQATLAPSRFQACTSALPLLMLGLPPAALRARGHADWPPLGRTDGAPAQADDGSAPPRFGAAVAAFRSRRYGQAFDQFARLADAGHLPSSRLALAMLQNSHLLLDADIDCALARQSRWRRQVAAGAGVPAPLAARPNLA